jgi:hypothetical protein
MEEGGGKREEEGWGEVGRREEVEEGRIEGGGEMRGSSRCSCCQQERFL